jgi:drug/metabolite transporter (DMT)-like permease
MRQTLIQWEDYHGLGGNANKPYSRTTALPMLPAFCANLFALPLLFRHHWTEEAQATRLAERNATMLRRLYDPRMFVIAFCAIIGEIANQSSIILAGSLTFTVVYSSVTIWTALFGIPLLHKSPNRIQWTALVLIVVGLLSSAMSHTANKDVALVPHHNVSAYKAEAELEKAEVAASSADFFVGTVCGMVGSMAYAIMYVMTEKVQKAADAPPPEALCVFVGMVGTAVLLLYIALWDGPSWKNLVNDQLSGSYYDIV